ncbi:MAG: hypothetical protein K8V75_05795 [Methanobrevibacter woesei]|nr:hypothetical protein [Methanobrevibacter woesei]
MNKKVAIGIVILIVAIFSVGSYAYVVSDTADVNEEFINVTVDNTVKSNGESSSQVATQSDSIDTSAQDQSYRNGAGNRYQADCPYYDQGTCPNYNSNDCPYNGTVLTEKTVIMQTEILEATVRATEMETANNIGMVNVKVLI